MTLIEIQPETDTITTQLNCNFEYNLDLLETRSWSFVGKLIFIGRRERPSGVEFFFTNKRKIAWLILNERYQMVYISVQYRRSNMFVKSTQEYVITPRKSNHIKIMFIIKCHMSPKIDVSEKIIKCALLYEQAYIYGDYVRDVIIRKLDDFDKINIMMATYGDKVHFIHVLNLMFDNVHVDNENNKLRVNNLIDIDVVVQHDSISSSLVGGIWLVKHDTKNHFTNMTCDVFSMTANGIQISTSIERFFECVRDCERKEFSFIPSKVMSESTVIDRAVSLTESGWTMKSSSCSFSIEAKVNECSICLEKNYATFITTSCNHVYHVDCFKQAIEQKMQCPICRNEKILCL